MSTGARPEDKAGHLSLDWGKRLLNYRQVALNVYKGLKVGTEQIYPDKYAAEFSLSLKAIAAV